jgi:hypothetical protein
VDVHCACANTACVACVVLICFALQSGPQFVDKPAVCDWLPAVLCQLILEIVGADMQVFGPLHVYVSATVLVGCAMYLSGLWAYAFRTRRTNQLAATVLTWSRTLGMCFGVPLCSCRLFACSSAESDRMHGGYSRSVGYTNDVWRSAVHFGCPPVMPVCCVSQLRSFAGRVGSASGQCNTEFTTRCWRERRRCSGQPA